MSTADQFTLPKIPDRPIDGHKGTFGTVGIIGGSEGATDPLAPVMIGAPALVAMGANRVGCGLVKVAAPNSILNHILTLAPHATGYPIANNEHAVVDRISDESDVLVVGPGLGSNQSSDRLVRCVLDLECSMRTKTVLLDADALNTVSQFGHFQKPSSITTILTPHPGEAHRLLDAFGISAIPDGNEQERIDACSALAQHTQCIVVLKGHRTVVSNGSIHWVCQHGHPCLGVGGSGDVLAGVISGLCARLVAVTSLDPFAITCLAVDLHARAGDLWGSTHKTSGLNPLDLGSYISKELDESCSV